MVGKTGVTCVAVASHEANLAISKVTKSSIMNNKTTEVNTIAHSYSLSTGLILICHRNINNLWFER